MSNFKFSKRSNAVLDATNLDKQLVTLAHRALEKSNYDFGFNDTSGVRTKKIQRQLYDQGKSKCDGTHKISKHQLGKALDFYAFDKDGKAVDGTSIEGAFIMSHIALAFSEAANEMNIKIRSGVFFDGYPPYGDIGHIELI